MIHDIKAIVDVNGATFIGIDFESLVTLKGGKKNPMQGRVTKRVIGATAMLFTNTNTNSYANMIKKRLLAEGKNPEFVVSPRKWGERISGTPFIVHTKDGQVKHYLEVIFLNPGKTEYFLDGRKINKEEIEGLDQPKVSETSQNGLEEKVQIRTIGIDSIVGIRTNGAEYVGAFSY